ncbi:DNA repair protein RadC [Lachnospiraceae bacterium PF1-21]
MKENNRMRELATPERPYEKFHQYGGEALSDRELLAIILRSGTKGENALELAGRILYGQGRTGLLDLHGYSYEKLLKIKGIGSVKAIQILCLIELGKRLSKARTKIPLCFNEPRTVAAHYMEDLRHQSREILKLLMLNTKAALIAEKDISVGTVNAGLVSPREIFLEALGAGAVSIILLHNHPSGDPTPSREDIKVTRRVQEAGTLLGIELLDHIIIGDCRYVSFRQEEKL